MYIYKEKHLYTTAALHYIHHRGVCVARAARIARVVGSMLQIRTCRPARTSCVPKAAATTQQPSTPSVLPYMPHNKPRVEAQPGQPPIVILPGFGNNTQDYVAPFGDQTSSVVTALQVPLTTVQCSCSHQPTPRPVAFQCFCRSSSAPTGSTSPAACSQPASGPRPAPQTRYANVLHTDSTPLFLYVLLSVFLVAELAAFDAHRNPRPRTLLPAGLPVVLGPGAGDCGHCSPCNW